MHTSCWLPCSQITLGVHDRGSPDGQVGAPKLRAAAVSKRSQLMQRANAWASAPAAQKRLLLPQRWSRATTQIWLQGHGGSRRAGVTSRPLFMSVALSTVILRPIDQLGCFSASATVTSAGHSDRCQSPHYPTPLLLLKTAWLQPPEVRAELCGHRCVRLHSEVCAVLERQIRRNTRQNTHWRASRRASRGRRRRWPSG